MRIPSVLVLTALLLWFFTSTTFAQEASKSAFPAEVPTDIGISKITPASPFYFLKAVREIVETKLALTGYVKMVREVEFSNRRLREAKSLVGNREDLIEPTLERYWSLQNSISAKGLRDELATHIKVLEKMHDQSTNPRAKMSIRATLYKLMQRIDVPVFAQDSACNFLAKEASSSALTEAEQAVLRLRVRECLKNF